MVVMGEYNKTCECIIVHTITVTGDTKYSSNNLKLSNDLNNFSKCNCFQLHMQAAPIHPGLFTVWRGGWYLLTKIKYVCIYKCNKNKMLVYLNVHM